MLAVDELDVVQERLRFRHGIVSDDFRVFTAIPRPFAFAVFAVTL